MTRARVFINLARVFFDLVVLVIGHRP
jgi:hypothetical protein